MIALYRLQDPGTPQPPGNPTPVPPDPEIPPPVEEPPRPVPPPPIDPVPPPVKGAGQRPGDSTPRETATALARAACGAVFVCIVA